MKPKVKTSPTRQTLEELERANRLREQVQVLAQPHRRGDDSAETDPLGMFVRIHMRGMFTHDVAERSRSIYDAGWAYFRLVYRWRRAKGIPNEVRLDEVENVGGGELEDGTVNDWGAKIRGCEQAMKCSGVPGFEAAQRLLLFPFHFPAEPDVGPVSRALLQLAIELGKMPF